MDVNGVGRGAMETFEKDIWSKIIKIAEEKKETGEPFRTIDRGNKNWVIKIMPSGISVQSEKNYMGKPNGKPRNVSKEALKEAWELLKKNGKMNREDMSLWFSDDNKIIRTGAIIRGILSCLPNISIEEIKGIKTLVYKETDC